MTWFRHKPPAQPTPEVAAELIKSDKQNERAKQKHQEALTLTAKLHQIRERNHFGESLEGIYREKR